LETASVEIDDNKRKQEFNAFQKIIAEEIPVINLIALENGLQQAREEPHDRRRGRSGEFRRCLHQGRRRLSQPHQTKH
jgi:hypothetical protein